MVQVLQYNGRGTAMLGRKARELVAGRCCVMGRSALLNLEVEEGPGAKGCGRPPKLENSAGFSPRAPRRNSPCRHPTFS